MLQQESCSSGRDGWTGEGRTQNENTEEERSRKK